MGRLHSPLDSSQSRSPFSISTDGATIELTSSNIDGDCLRKHATLIIENNGSLEELRDLLKEVWSEALKRNA